MLTGRQLVSRFQFHKGTIRTKLQNQQQGLNANFNSIKVRLEPPADDVPTPPPAEFQFHKGTIRTTCLCENALPLKYFNSIKVRLEPIVWGYITSLFSIGFVDAKLINIIEKMSMGDYIFLCVLRQPLYLLVLQQVKDLNDAWE